MPKALHVYITNEGLHDYSQAKEFGEEVVSLTTGSYSRVNVTRMIRDMTDYIEASSSEDWILISGPPTINCIACVLFALQHGRLNLLIHTSREDLYVPRTVVF